ncbi:uncharacterized protein LOC110038937 [Phalaenopsis equestris]|uniref:uncharacterized protein LOC110038937 n=1 Tax=Phalaenopsis equestris TaxID=78828 RepID=UPI0009E3C27C|nr:uncharacterized protein LOC110038937 [Phalaenopsis equestris]
MRLIELVRCGRPVVVEDSPLPFTSSEEPEKRRREQPGAHSGAYSTWRPSLGSISEDGLNLIPSAKSTPSPAKVGKNPDKGRPRRAATARRRERDFSRHYDVPAVFPAFPPTLFMF